MPTDIVYLASASPRRRDLLQQIGVSFRCVGTAVDESALPGEAPEAYVRRLAAAKAEAGWQAAGGAAGAPVLGADTAVVRGGTLMGKPRDRDDALSMLQRLSGRSHRVLTAVALRTQAGLGVAVSDSEVWFRDIDAAEAAAYWDSGEPKDKAGAYAIQGLAAVFVVRLHGSYSGVMGLPLFETAQLLRAAGVPCWRPPTP